eukprot:2331596-Pleurochrysis_carterae.AAC.1
MPKWYSHGQQLCPKQTCFLAVGLVLDGAVITRQPSLEDARTVIIHQQQHYANNLAAIDPPCIQYKNAATDPVGDVEVGGRDLFIKGCNRKLGVQ